LDFLLEVLSLLALEVDESVALELHDSQPQELPYRACFLITHLFLLAFLVNLLPENLPLEDLLKV
jgi:hypothetical protein